MVEYHQIKTEYRHLEPWTAPRCGVTFYPVHKSIAPGFGLVRMWAHQPVEDPEREVDSQAAWISWEDLIVWNVLTVEKWRGEGLATHLLHLAFVAAGPGLKASTDLSDDAQAWIARLTSREFADLPETTRDHVREALGPPKQGEPPAPAT